MEHRGTKLLTVNTFSNFSLALAIASDIRRITGGDALNRDFHASIGASNIQIRDPIIFGSFLFAL